MEARSISALAPLRSLRSPDSRSGPPLADQQCRNGSRQLLQVGDDGDSSLAQCSTLADIASSCLGCDGNRRVPWALRRGRPCQRPERQPALSIPRRRARPRPPHRCHQSRPTGPRRLSHRRLRRVFKTIRERRALNRRSTDATTVDWPIPRALQVEHRTVGETATPGCDSDRAAHA